MWRLKIMRRRMSRKIEMRGGRERGEGLRVGWKGEEIMKL